MNALSIAGLNKTYGDGTRALENVDLSVQEGDFFALLGPNGAGKTTIIGVISTLVRKDAGKVSVFGFDLDKDIRNLKRQLGVVPQEFNFNIFETPWQIIFNQAGYYGINRKKARENTEYLLEKLGLTEKSHLQSMKLSGGMKRRLLIARALVHEPRLLILDEPTAGVDIELRRSTWDFVRELNRNGTTIILTTHYLEEAENLCRNMAIINSGKIITSGPVKKLLADMQTQTVIFDLKKKMKKPPVLRDFGVSVPDDMTLEIEIPRSKGISQLFTLLARNQIEIASFRNKTGRLEELFVRLTQKGSGR